MSIFSVFKKEDKKRPLRDKHGRPYYLKKLPIWQRKPKEFIIIGSMISLGIYFSAPIYYFFFAKPEDSSPMDTWWPHEKARGVRDVDIIRARKAAAGPNASMADVFKGPYQPGEVPAEYVSKMN